MIAYEKLRTYVCIMYIYVCVGVCASVLAWVFVFFQMLCTEASSFTNDGIVNIYLGTEASPIFLMNEHDHIREDVILKACLVLLLVVF